MTSPDFEGLGREFALPGRLVHSERVASGHIHDTYVVEYETERGPARFVHQRLNESVFPDCRGVMANIRAVTAHIRAGLARNGGGDGRRGVLTFVATTGGEDLFRDGGGGLWRTAEFLEGTVARDVVLDAKDAREAGRAFGAFQRALSDFQGGPLIETIPGFHDTRRRFEAFQDALSEDPCRRSAEAVRESRFLLDREPLSDALGASARLPERIAHNDAKLANVLLDEATGESVCVIDLDTVMPGLSVHDFGDLVRSCTVRAAEDEEDLDRVRVDGELFRGVASGFLQECAGVLTQGERDSLLTGASVICYEQALRFLTDHLRGDTYYKVRKPRHNLLRARTQLCLVRALEEDRPLFEDWLGLAASEAEEAEGPP